MAELTHGLKVLAIVVGVSLIGGIWLSRRLYRHHLKWTWALVGLPLTLIVLHHSRRAGACVGGASLVATLLGAGWHRQDLHIGVDFADAAENVIGLRVAARRLRRRVVRDRAWVANGRLEVGVDRRGLPVTVPVGYRSGTHTLVVGATGSGKTVSEAWAARRLVEQGHAAVVIDPKGDALLMGQLQQGAARAGRRFVLWSPDGPAVYNPYARGGDTEVADKALAAEAFTEPHYQRQAQRYLGHVARTMRAASVEITPASLVAHMDPRELEATARRLDEADGALVHRYLDSLTDRQRRDLAGVRDRLSILAESDIAPWLAPGEDSHAIELASAVTRGDVVYFRLDADRRPLVAQMLAAAIVSDLIALVAELQSEPTPTVVVLDEFGAIASEHVSRLFARSRSAGVSLILATQELADLAKSDAALQSQVLANVQTIIAHRQNVPVSAELIAEVAGTKPVWVTTEQTDELLLGVGRSGLGTRRRGHEFHVHPAQIKQLVTGQAVVVTPGTGRPLVARMHHPRQAHA